MSNKKDKEPARMGRPPKITKEWADSIAPDLPDLWRNGESLAEVCATLDICKESYYKACSISPNFSDSDKKGRELSEAWWTRLGRNGAQGAAEIQPTTWIFNMKNRFNWKDKHEHTGKQDGPLFGSGEMSDEELREELERRGLPTDGLLDE